MFYPTFAALAHRYRPRLYINAGRRGTDRTVFSWPGIGRYLTTALFAGEPQQSWEERC